MRSVEPGERVWAYDFGAGVWFLTEVEWRHDGEFEGPMVTLDLGESSVTATAMHPFWVVAGDALEDRPGLFIVERDDDRGLSLPGRWVNSHDLRAGDVLFLRSSKCAVVRAVRAVMRRQAVCNLTVRDWHSYAVGEAGVLVHNTSPTNGPQPPAGGAGQRPAPSGQQGKTKVGYRIVEDAELQDIIARGEFRFPPGGDTPTGRPGKWFYSTRAEALDTAGAWTAQRGGPFTLIRTEVPTSSITWRGRIDHTPTMPKGKKGFFSEFGQGLGNQPIEINPPP
jgi:hypothetical protein